MKPWLVLGAASLLAAAAVPSSPPTPAPTSAGERAFARCVACHSTEPGEDTPAGPTLRDVVGRRIAARPGFDYSPAMRSFAHRHGRWSPRLLDRFLAAPETVVPGTEMSSEGIADPAERRALIDWLRRTG